MASPEPFHRINWTSSDRAAPPLWNPTMKENIGVTLKLDGE
jgi:hypothetical protein